jgi:NAD(P)-dependent dehydrogenase (short-subunit alcohol dehydrogenase family)
LDIQDKVALVTGAASGIGRATALRLACEGAAVVVVDIDEAGGRETVRRIETAGGRAAFVRADVTNDADAQAMVAFAEEAFGRLDILHNNAGVFTDRPRFPDAEPERWARVLEVNLRGVILGTHYGIQSLRKRGGGVIVNTASLAGIIGFATDPVYAATKGGIVLFTASLTPLKDELNIRVNCVCPGIVDTPLLQRAEQGTPEEERRVAEQLRQLPLIPPEEVADAVVELIRDDSLVGRAMLIPNGRPRELAPPPAPARIGT